MGIASILVPCGLDSRRGARLRLAADAARRLEAFLDVVCLTSDRNDAVLGPAELDALEAEVHALCRDCSYSWSVLEDEGDEALIRRAGLADLAVVGLSAAEDGGNGAMALLPSRLAEAVPCPVLILPSEGTFALPRSHLLVAWKNSREAGRALRDALPLLARAEQVTVLTVGAEQAGDGGQADVAVFLERHGVEAECLVDPAADSDAGAVILARAQELDCDGIILGACGHSRLHDWALGSATHSVLTGAAIPVLMSH